MRPVESLKVRRFAGSDLTFSPSNLLTFNAGGSMLRIDAMQAIYDRLEQCVVVTI